MAPILNKGSDEPSTSQAPEATTLQTGTELEAASPLAQCELIDDLQLVNSGIDDVLYKHYLSEQANTAEYIGTILSLELRAPLELEKLNYNLFNGKAISQVERLHHELREHQKAENIVVAFIAKNEKGILALMHNLKDCGDKKQQMINLLVAKNNLYSC